MHLSVALSAGWTRGGNGWISLGILKFAAESFVVLMVLDMHIL